MHASEVSRTYVVLSWEPPAPRGKEPLTYFIEKVRLPSRDRQSLRPLCHAVGLRDGPLPSARPRAPSQSPVTELRHVLGGKLLPAHLRVMSKVTGLRELARLCPPTHPL